MNGMDTRHSGELDTQNWRTWPAYAGVIQRDELDAADATLERRRAVRQWLLAAADDVSRAQREWRDEGVALLRCGGLWGVIRIEGALVHAAAGTSDPAAVDRYLAETLRGPVFTNLASWRYYALVGASTGYRPDWKRACDDAEYMGVGHSLGVPAPDRTDPTERRYWCVEADRPGVLVAAGAVARLVQVGRDRLATEQGG